MVTVILVLSVLQAIVLVYVVARLQQPAPSITIERQIPAAVDLSVVYQRLDDLTKRPVLDVEALAESVKPTITTQTVDLSGLSNRLDQILKRPDPAPVDLSGVMARLEQLAAVPPVDLSKVSDVLARIEKSIRPVDLSGIQKRLENIDVPMPPVDLSKVYAHLEHLKTLVQQVDLAPIFARVERLESAPPVDLSKVHAQLKQIEQVARPMTVDFSGLSAQLAQMGREAAAREQAVTERMGVLGDAVRGLGKALRKDEANGAPPQQSTSPAILVG